MFKNVQDYTIKKNHHRDHELHSGKSEETCIKIENQEGDYIVNHNNTSTSPIQTFTAPQANTNSVAKMKKEISSQEHQSQGLG